VRIDENTRVTLSLERALGWSREDMLPDLSLIAIR